MLFYSSINLKFLYQLHQVTVLLRTVQAPVASQASVIKGDIETEVRLPPSVQR